MATRPAASLADRHPTFWSERVRRRFSFRRYQQIPPDPSGAESQCWISLVGPADPLSMDEKMENSGGALGGAESFIASQSGRFYLTARWFLQLFISGASFPAVLDERRWTQANK